MGYLILVICIFLFYFLLSIADIGQNGTRIIHRINNDQTKIITVFSIFILILFVTFRPDNMPDYKSYIDDFRYLDRYRDLTMELGDKVLINFVHLFSEKYIWVFFVFALISIPLKVIAIRRMAPFFFVSMAIFTSGILIAQDMVAIRSAIAVGFFFWAIKYKLEQKYWKCILFSILSILFHYSAVIIIIPFCFFSTKNLNKKIFWILIPAAYAIVLAGVGITKFFELIHIEKFQQLWEYYKYTDEEDAYNIFNLFLLGKCAMYYYILIKIDEIKKSYPEAVFFLKIYCLSLMLTILLYESQSMAIRVGEFLGAVEILLIPSIIFSYKKKNQYLGYGVCFAYCIGLLLCYGVFFFEK